MSDFKEILPVWNKTGVEPPLAKKDAGWQIDERPPAEYMNWLFNRICEVLAELQQNASHKADAGDLTTLTTTAKNTIVAAINELDKDTGALAGLSTTQKSNLVAAVNEVFDKVKNDVGDLAHLSTTIKSSVVAAINDVNAQMAQKASNKSQQQTDYTKLFTHSHFQDTSIKKLSATEIELSAYDDKNGVAYRLIKDPNDEFYKLGRGSHFLHRPKTSKLTVTTSGTGWNTQYTNWYTETIGDSFNFSFAGEKCIIQFYNYTNGGMWEIRDNGVVIKKVSAYSDPASYNYVSLLLENKEHDITCVFVGEDSLHPTATPRGGIKGVDGVETFNGVERISIVDILHDISNKEFAFSVSYGGSSFWFPEHNNVGTMFAHSFSVQVDNVSVDINGLSIGSEVKGKTVSVQQIMSGYTALNGTKLADFRIQHILGTDGVIQYNGKMTASNSFTISAGYPLMLPVDGTKHNIVISGYGTKQVSDNSGNYYYFTNEKDDCFNVMTTTNISGYGSYVTFARVEKPLTSLRYGKTDKPSKEESMFLWQRSNLPKTYFQSMKSTPFSSGDIYNWSGKIGIRLVNSQSNFI